MTVPLPPPSLFPSATAPPPPFPPCLPLSLPPSCSIPPKASQLSTAPSRRRVYKASGRYCLHPLFFLPLLVPPHNSPSPPTVRQTCSHQRPQHHHHHHHITERGGSSELGARIPLPRWTSQCTAEGQLAWDGLSPCLAFLPQLLNHYRNCSVKPATAGHLASLSNPEVVTGATTTTTTARTIETVRAALTKRRCLLVWQLRAT